MIRPFEPSDTSVLIDVWHRASAVGHPFLSESFLEREREQMAEKWLPGSETSIYEVEGQPVGFVSMVGNEVGGLFVDPDFHGRGVGRALLDHVRTGRTHLELGVFEENQSARRFYSRYGFEEIEASFNEEAGHRELRLRIDFES